MSRKVEQRIHETVVKRTRQGGKKPKLSGMNKRQKANFKAYRGQGR